MLTDAFSLLPLEATAMLVFFEFAAWTISEPKNKIAMLIRMILFISNSLLYMSQGINGFHL